MAVKKALVLSCLLGASFLAQAAPASFVVQDIQVEGLQRVTSASPLPAFDPKAGLYSVDAGVDVMVALSRHWVAVGGVSVSQLQGDARRSPLTQRASNYGASIGVAYRYGR